MPPPSPHSPSVRAITPGSDAARFGSGSGLVLLGLALGRGLRLLTRILIGRLLGAASLGLFELAWTLIQILTFAARSGLHIAVVRFGAPLWDEGRPLALRRLVLQTLLMPLALGGAVALALALSAPWLATAVFDNPELSSAIRILAGLVPIGSGLAVLAAATQATQRMRLTVLTRDLAEPSLQFILFLALWASGFGLASALWGTFAAGSVAFVLALVVVLRLTGVEVGERRAEVDEQVTSLRQLFLFSLPVAVTGLLGAYLMWIDRLLVGYFLTVTDVGIYAAAAQFGVLFGLILYGFSTMFAPMFTRLLEEGENERMGELYRVSTKWGLYLLLPLMAVMAVVPEVLLSGLFGPEFLAGSRPLQILLLGQLANISAGQVGMILILSGHQRTWMAVNAAAVGLNLLLDVLWIPRYGLEGAAAASALTLALLFSTAVFFVHRRLGLRPLDRRSGRLVVPILAAIGALLVLRTVGLPATVAGLLVAVLVSYSVAVLGRLVQPADSEDGEFVELLWRRLRSVGGGDQSTP